MSANGTRSRSVIALVACLMALSVGNQVLAAPHTIPEATGYTSSPIGLTSGQVARLTVVNNGTTNASETLTILDDMGATLATRTVGIAPGHRASLDYMTGDARQEIYGRVGPRRVPR